MLQKKKRSNFGTSQVGYVLCLSRAFLPTASAVCVCTLCMQYLSTEDGKRE